MSGVALVKLTGSQGFSDVGDEGTGMFVAFVLLLVVNGGSE